MEILEPAIGPGAPGVEVKGIGEILNERTVEKKLLLEEERKIQEAFAKTLAGQVIARFHENRDAKRQADIEEEIFKSNYQVNGEYTPEERAKIRSGSDIFMGITSTKQRAARSWIRDILLPHGRVPFLISSAVDEAIPEEVLNVIETAFEEDKKRLETAIDEKYQKLAEKGKSQEGGEQGEQLQPFKSAAAASKKLRETSKLRRDIDRAIKREIHRVAQADIKTIQTDIENELDVGGFHKAIGEFIDDFTTYPTAFLKGPMITTAPKMVWSEGELEVEQSTVYKDKVIHPLDAYPSPAARTVQDGDFIEHLRLTDRDLSKLSKLPAKTGYRSEKIKEVMLAGNKGTAWYDTGIESRRADMEKRGSVDHAEKGLYHALHFWGGAKIETLKTWGINPEDVVDYEDHEYVEIEAILVGDEIIKCVINNDPLERRPYYASSLQKSSGSIWGRSLPFLMRDSQRMCNACARALADNMGFSSGPQVAVNVDRLADKSKLSQMTPRKLWQFTSDPTGSNAKPIEFFNIPSNAQELLGVYDKFEIKSDDATGVPRYAYGNEQSRGAAATVSGLAMLLESASKGIKASIKNLSTDVIVPRIHYQFYAHLLAAKEAGNPKNFSGTVEVKISAVEALTIRAAEQESRVKLLQAVTNPTDSAIIGMEGRGRLLQEIFKDVNLPEDIIPGGLDLKELQEKADTAAQQEAASADQRKGELALKTAEMQIAGQDRMNTRSQETKMADIKRKEKKDSTELQLKSADMQRKAEADANKLSTAKDKVQAGLTATDRKLAVDLAKAGK